MINKNKTTILPNGYCQTTTDKSQCQAPNLAQSPLIHPFASPGQQIGQLKNNQYQRNPLFNPIPSALLLGLIVILIFVALGALYLVLSRRSSWKFNLWPPGVSASATGTTGNGSGAANRSGGQSEPSD